jgi:hypothetical protein
MCGKEIYKTEYQMSLGHKHHLCSDKCKSVLWRRMFKGENNPAYIDGRSKNKRCYRGDDWEDIRLSIYVRDNFTCRICKCKCVSKRDYDENNKHLLIQCHHIDGYKDERDNDMNKLVTLCVTCHALMHQNKKFRECHNL